jgi:IrrE N-terminal-like domain
MLEITSYGSQLAERANSLSGHLPLWVRLNPICRKLGVKSVRRELLSNGQALLLNALGDPVILLNCNRKYGASAATMESSGGFSPSERFAIAHEIGHLILLREGVPRPNGASEYWQHEAICDQFARHLLIGDKAIHRLNPAKARADDFLRYCKKLASDARVPWSSAAHRITQLNPGWQFLRTEPREYGFLIVVSTVKNGKKSGWRETGKRIKPGQKLYDILRSLLSANKGTKELSPDALGDLIKFRHVTACAARRERDGIRIAFYAES